MKRKAIAAALLATVFMSSMLIPNSTRMSVRQVNS